ncbi:hypothetical protein AY601_4902 [Pedobacter cryoconitis]|uniref:Uncharacterized protein n=1 Tax=Pedobacter cryoconitis TaxID=188932 RepID=A0A127VKC0_9SPHI|nr:hypothetical protein [Pedobacter cryoconitis]AMQ01722.1 hypothetical protein AY601_4902 [Pedobacter cryoconitis]
MKHQAPQIGRYQVLKAYNEMHNGKETPVAEVLYMQFNWTEFDTKIRKVRLRSLYNSNSEGPKQDFPIDKLYLHYLLINEMHETNISEKPQYCVKWEVIKPDNYNELIEEDNEIAADFLLCDQVMFSNKEYIDLELSAVEMDQCLADEFTKSENTIVNQGGQEEGD